MKKVFLATITLLGIIASQLAQAQYYIIPNLTPGRNPNSVNQDNELAYGGVPGWSLLATGDSASAAQPVWTGVQTLPFAFQMNGQSFTTYKVSSSGVLTFSTAATAVPPTLNTALPSAQVPNNSVCVWGTLLTANADYVVSKTFGTAPFRQHWVQFNSATLPFPTGTGTSPIVGSLLYASIVLEETTNKVYLVWQRSSSQPQSLTAGIQLDATTAVQLPASPSVSIPSLSDTTPADNVYYEFGPGNQPAYDISAASLTLPATALRGANLAVRGEFRNQGTQDVTSLTVSYRVANGPVVSAVLSNYLVPTQNVGTFIHPTRWVPSTGGVLPVKVWVSLPNGQPDQNPANDTLRATVVVADSTMRRKVVEEDFTSSTCNPYCRLGNINTRAINTQPINRNKQVEIKYQQNFPSPGNDPYYTVEGRSRFDFYQGTGIPYMMLDGGWSGNSQTYTAGILDQFQSQPAFARVQGTYTLTGGRLVTANAQIKPFFAAPAGRLVVHMAITERHTVLNARTNGETDFYDVMKKMMPNQYGTLLPALASGQVFNLSQSFDVSTLPSIQAVEHFDSLRVVVFVQDKLTNQVYQGEQMTLRNPLATRNAQTGPAFSLYPNPTTGRTALQLNLSRPETVRVEVLDMLGRNVLDLAPQALGIGAQELSLNLTHQAAGLYTVRLTSSQGVRTSKLTLE
ncbi:T9SS type A sorting domain-containing protein [Hymenobacter rubidus]|uniref:T9SS type A sorting domain-containing protein n=1 Tax=Hymenobacter rubidus TaxID=1441626 RepID=UPI00191E2A10|nr:T9SS type A sorting domain-containing protein [Hymenobacter rubidus]